MQNQWMTVEVEGTDEVIRQIQQIKSKIESESERIMLQAAFILESEVKRLITNMKLVDTGTLKASIHSFVRQRFGITESVVGSPMEYAPFTEFGTGQKGSADPHPAKPAWYKYGDGPGIQSYKFMWTAWQNKKDEIYEYIEREYRKLVDADVDLTPGFGI